MWLIFTAVAVRTVSGFHPPPIPTQTAQRDDIELKTSQLEKRTDSVERTMGTFVRSMTEIKSMIKSLQSQCAKEEFEKKIAHMFNVSSENSRKLQVLESQCKEKPKGIHLSSGLQSNNEIQKLEPQGQEKLMVIHLSEIQKLEPQKKESPCSSHKGYHQASSTLCLRLILRDKKTWNDSRKSCQTDGGDLVTFHDQHEQNDLATFMKPHGAATKSLWVGVRKVKNSFETISDNNFIGKWVQYRYPPPAMSKCAILTIHGLIAKYCNLRQGYICQIRLPTTG